MTAAGLTETLLNLERMLATRSTAAAGTSLGDLLADDFREFGRSGKVWTKATILPELAGDSIADAFHISDFKVQRLSDSIALVTYLAHRTFENEPDMLTNRSSIWRRDMDNDWRMVFHQGTPTE